jgi:hypothetical protein
MSNKDSGLLRCNTLSVEETFLTFGRVTVPFFFFSGSSNLTLKGKALWSFETSVNTCSLAHYGVLEDFVV